MGGCRTVGDLDGDGLDDVYVGAPLGGSEGVASGTAFVFFGPAEATSAADADIAISGETANDSFGLSLGIEGDLDGDGTVDLAVGAPQALSAGAGVVGVFYGPLASGSYDSSAASAFIVGDREEDALGLVGMVGDLDGDGRTDLLLTAPGAFDSAGAAYLFLGSGI